LDLFIILFLIAVSSWGVVTAVVVTMGLWCAIADGRRRTATRALEASPGRLSSVSKSSVDADSEELTSLRRLDVGSGPARPAVTGTCRTAGSRLVPFEATEPSLS
jgi:hypothetical protein